MRTNWILTTAVVALSVTAAVGAQSGKAMGKPSKGDAMSTTYTGCVESVNHGSAFLLTKVAAWEPMHGDMAMKHHDGMSASMKHDDKAMKGDAGEKMDAMASKSFALVGSANLGKHVGQKVSVTGSLSEGSMDKMQDVSTFTVKSLKVIAKSCS